MSNLRRATRRFRPQNAFLAFCAGMLWAAPAVAKPLPDGFGQQDGQQLAVLTLDAETPAAVAGSTYMQVFTLHGGQGPYKLTESGALPNGLSWLPTDTGAVLTGKPSQLGEFTVRLLGRDALGQSVERALTLEVNVRPKALGPIMVNIPEAVTTTDTLSVLTPVYVTITETLTTTDALGAQPPVSVNLTESLTITDTVQVVPGPALPLSLDAQILPGGTYQGTYNAQFHASGGVPPYSFSVIGGTIPPGLTLSSGGALTGTFASYGGFAFTVNVTDSKGNYSPREFSIQVSAGTTGTTTQTIASGTSPNVSYADPSFSLNLSASSGLPLVYNVTSGPATGHNPFTITGAGLVLVQVTQPGNSTYAAATPVTTYLFINKAPITVTPNAKTRAFETANPDASSYTFQLSGFVRGDNASVVTGSVTAVSTTAVANSPAGPYPTTPDTSGLFATNYQLNPGTGTLTVTGGAAQTIFFVKPPDISVNQMTHLAGFTTSGLPVSYSVSGPATLTGNYVRATGAGTITVTATQSGNATYNAATSVVRSFTAQ